MEFLGLTNSPDFSNAGFPNFVWFNIKKRENAGLPNELIAFQTLNDEIYLCIDTGKILGENESVISVWNNESKIIEQELHIGFNN